MPGPDIIYVSVQGLTRGRKAGLAVSLGLCSGLFFHTMAAALGLSLIILNSPTLFNLIRYAGVGYLVYMGIRCLISANAPEPSDSPSVADSTPQESFGRLYRRGITMNVLNPKVLIFFLAFLPQFLDYGSSTPTADIFVLGGVFAVQALIIFTAVSLLSGFFSEKFAGRLLSGKAVSIINGAVYLAIAVVFLLSKSPAI